MARLRNRIDTDIDINGGKSGITSAPLMAKCSKDDNAAKKYLDMKLVDKYAMDLSITVDQRHRDDLNTSHICELGAERA